MPATPTQRKKNPARAVAAGATLGRFRVVRVVSRRPGIDAIVEAKSEAGTRVALTVLGDAFDDDPALRSTTLKQVKQRAELDDPHLLPLRGPWQSSGRVFYASVPPGQETLADRLRDGAMKPGAALRIAGHVASALQLGAAQGLVHHDLTPAAITLKDGDKALIGDFGISSPPASGCELLQRDGSVDYRSPEELLGEPAGARSNVYSLACILVECLTGTPPHRHDRPLLTLHAHLVEPPPRISQRAHGLPARIDAVIAQAMARNPRERFGTPAELVEAAGRALGIDARVPVSDAERKLRAQEKAAVRERRRTTRRERRSARGEQRGTTTRRERQSGRGEQLGTTTRRERRSASGEQRGTTTRRRPSRVAVWAGVALFASAMSGFATGSADWSGGDPAPATRPPARSSTSAALREAAQQQRADYLRAVHRTVVRLGERRAKGRQRLRVARSPAGQAAAAKALAGAYRDARRTLPAPPTRSFADARLDESMRAAEHAYRGLVGAAHRGNAVAWKVARGEAVIAEEQVKQALRKLRSP